MSELHISHAPHIHQKGSSTNRIMLDVIIALMPATIVSCVFFGLPALWIILVCVASAVLAEFLFNLCVKKKQTICDLSAVVTGLLLALNLSKSVALWQCVIGSVFAIVVVKCLFGGIGKNIVNPAIAARVLLLLTFGSVGLTANGAMNPLDYLTIDKAFASGATPLPLLKQGAELNPLDLLLGLHGGAIGEVCALALLAGYVYLVVRKVIKWYVPFSFVATVFGCFFLFEGFDVVYALNEVLAGGVLLGAIFMATDYVTTPNTNLGRIIFGIGCGLLTYLIRQFGGYPEGVSIAILTMNLVAPFITDLTKKKTLGGIK